MFKLVKILCALTANSSAFSIETEEDRQLEYVFEIVRHGARAPSTPDPKFEAEGTGYYELSQIGMRQRYLLGRYNLLKYGDVIKNLNVQSTFKYRTLQSGYAEILGMHHGNDNVPVLKQKVGKLPFEVRRRNEIETELKNQAAPDGFIYQPIYTFTNYDWEDQLNGCLYPKAVTSKLGKLDSTYPGLMYLRDELLSANSKVFNKSESFFQGLTFSETHTYDSIIMTETYDMIPQAYYLNEKEQAAQDAMSKAKLSLPHPADSRILYVTKQLLAPINRIIKAVKNSNQEQNETKYLLYSAHDTNVANILNQIVPDYEWTSIPFAANIHIELYRIKGENEYQVRTMYNGKTLPTKNCQGEEYCDASDWLIGMGSMLYHGDLKAACNQKL